MVAIVKPKLTETQVRKERLYDLTIHKSVAHKKRLASFNAKWNVRYNVGMSIASFVMALGTIAIHEGNIILSWCIMTISLMLFLLVPRVLAGALVKVEKRHQSFVVRWEEIGLGTLRIDKLNDQSMTKELIRLERSAILATMDEDEQITSKEDRKYIIGHNLCRCETCVMQRSNGPYLPCEMREDEW